MQNAYGQERSRDKGKVVVTNIQQNKDVCMVPKEKNQDSELMEQAQRLVAIFVLKAPAPLNAPPPP